MGTQTWQCSMLNVSCIDGVQVDERMNTEGAGIIFGVNEPILGFILVGMFSLIWVLYATSAKEFGGQEEEDGLSL
jgi:photosystem II PsbW protein